MTDLVWTKPVRAMTVRVRLAAQNVQVSAMTEGTLAWLKSPAVRFVVLAKVIAPVQAAKVVRRRRLGDAPPPEGSYDVEAIASMLYAELRRAFPEEDIHVAALNDEESA